ncbi:MAG: hypothetical protein IPM34_07575 [Saprospiraceae bacterium]|nr:hypothetical protein [Saprospiraceae bacterium]
MKQFSILIALIFLSQSSFAQDTIRIEDILKRNKRVNSSKNLQKNNDDSGLLEDEILNKFKKAIEPYIYIVEVQYHLVKEKKIYGKGDSDYFGSKVGIGISTNKHIYIDPTILEPWKSDEDFTDYKEDYTPEIFKININEFGKESGILLADDKFKVKILDNGLGTLEVKDNEFKHLELTENIDNIGILISYSTVKGKVTNNFDVNIVYYHPDWTSGKSKLPEDIENQVGGFYLHIEPKSGSVTLSLAGIIVKNKQDKSELIQIKESIKSGNKETLPSKSEPISKKPILKEVKVKKK